MTAESAVTHCFSQNKIDMWLVDSRRDNLIFRRQQKVRLLTKNFSKNQLLLVIVFIGLLIFGLSIFNNNVKSSDQKTQDSKPLSPALAMEVRGLEFEGEYKGNKVISISAKRFVVEKKRLGGVRFGLHPQARLDKAVIRLYGGFSSETGQNTGRKTAANGNPVFKGLFSKTALGALPLKGADAIKVSPVVVEFVHNNETKARISAFSAELDSKTQNFRFRGRVNASAGPRSLQSEELIFNPETGTILARGRCRLKMPWGQDNMSQVETDILLNLDS